MGSFPALQQELDTATSKVAALEKMLSDAEGATKGKREEQAQYVTFLEMELQEAQSNAAEAKAVLQRYQEEITGKDALLALTEAEIIQLKLDVTHAFM